jgi:hypothetical protein
MNIDLDLVNSENKSQVQRTESEITTPLSLNSKVKKDSSPKDTFMLKQESIEMASEVKDLSRKESGNTSKKVLVSVPEVNNDNDDESSQSETHSRRSKSVVPNTPEMRVERDTGKAFNYKEYLT